MPKSLRIAVADDEPDLLDYFTRALVKSGHEVVVAASNGRELVERCRAERPDLLITDIRMDGINGIDAMRELAKDGPIPTILISAHYRAEDFNGQLDGGVVAFLRKPVKLADLAGAVAEAEKSLT
jgi:CheY-like chemotaxis protein